MLHITKDELDKWETDLFDKIQSMPDSEKQRDLAIHFMAFMARLRMNPRQVHDRKFLTSSCTQCLDTGYYYGGYYASVRKECTHPAIYQKEPEDFNLSDKYISDKK